MLTFWTRLRTLRPAEAFAALVMLGLAILIPLRALCLARPPCLAAHGERAWLGWAYRHPRVRQLFEEIAPQLSPGESIVIVAPHVTEEFWWRGMASYFLPEHPVAAVKDRSVRPSQVPPGQALVIVLPRGRAHVVHGAR